MAFQPLATPHYAGFRPAASQPISRYQLAITLKYAFAAAFMSFRHYFISAIDTY